MSATPASQMTSDLLREAAALFRTYEQSHRARGPEHLEKAEKNAEIANRIEKALTKPHATILTDGEIIGAVAPLYADEVAKPMGMAGDIQTVRAVENLLANRDTEHAQMYRFIRSVHWYDSPMAVVMNPKEAVKLGHYCPSGDLLDAEIQKLMKEKT